MDISPFVYMAIKYPLLSAFIISAAVILFVLWIDSVVQKVRGNE